MEFEIDFGEHTSRPEPAGPLYASVDGMVARLSAEECVFQVRGSDQVHVMTVDVLQAMDQMRRFAPLGRQVERIEGAIAELRGKRPAIERVVQSLVQRGLLVEAGAALSRALAGGRPAAPAAAPLVVRTCERPGALAALLASLPAEHASEVLVLDDSRGAEAVAENRRVCAAAPGPVRHLDRAWRERLVGHLGLDGTQRELLLPADTSVFSGGAAWNAALLLTAGLRPLFLDDDMRWELRRFQGGAGEIGLGNVLEPRIAFGVPGAQEPPGLAATEHDWLAALPQLCGQPLDQAAQALGTALDLGSLAGQDYRRFQQLLRGARVKTVRFGYYGDSCMDTRLWLYLARPGDLADLYRERGAYFRQLEAPLLAQGHDRPQIGEISSFTPTALDNSELVPPTVPVGRGEDFAFAAFLRYLHPDGLALHLPVLTRHCRPEGRPPENPDAHVPWASRFFAEFALAHQDECEAADPARRVQQLAARIDDLGAAPPARRAALLREFLGYLRAGVVERLQGTLLASAGAPDYFQRDLRDWIEAQGRALTETRSPLLRGWPGDLDAPGCADALAADARRLAAWLRAWPGLWEQARDRREELLEL